MTLIKQEVASNGGEFTPELESRVSEAAKIVETAQTQVVAVREQVSSERAMAKPWRESVQEGATAKL